MLPSYLKNISDTVSNEVVERNLSSLHLFKDVLRQLSVPDSELAKNNNTLRLLDSNFSSCPKVDLGYYDYKYNGVLYVNDFETGERIRKDQAILLIDGRFIKNTSSKIVNDWKVLRPSILSALNGNNSALLNLNNKIIFDYDNKVYIPFDLKMFYKTLSDRIMALIFRNIYYDFCDTLARRYSPNNVSDIDLTSYKAFFDANIHRYITGNVYVSWVYPSEEINQRFYRMASDSMFFPDYLITGDLCRSLEDGVRGHVNLNGDNNISYKPMGAVEILHTPNLPFDFSLYVNRQKSNMQNRRTQNNDGIIMAHNAKVDENKVSFRMTDAEKSYFGKFEEDWKKDHNLWKIKFDKAMSEGHIFRDKEPKIHPHNQPIYLGMELEAVVKGAYYSPEGYRKTLKDMADSKFGEHAIFKYDRSIDGLESNRTMGLEIVTIPATLSWHKEVFERDFFGTPNVFHQRLRVTDRCGIHVHIARNVFTPQTLGMFIAFINSADNSAFINNMANRPANKYCVRLRNPGRNAHGIDVSAKVAIKACRDNQALRGLDFRGRPRSDETRRVSVNIDNPHTIEVRIFKGSMNKNSILRKLEFCESLVKFVRSKGMQQMTVFDYVDWILTDAIKGDYPHMITWLASKKYIGHTREKIKGRNKLRNIYSENKIPFPKTSFHNKTNYPNYFKAEELA